MLMLDFNNQLWQSFGEGNCNPLQYSCLENPMDGEDWEAAVHGVTKSWTLTEWLHFHFSLSCIGEGNGNPLQCSCLENPRDGRAWWAAVYGVTESRTLLKQLSSMAVISSSSIFNFSRWKIPYRKWVRFSWSGISVSLWPHGLQHARPPCPSPTPRVYSKSYPLSRWYHPTISFSVIPISSHVQSFPASGSFQMCQFFTSGSQSIGVSASAPVLPMNIQNWFPLDGLAGSPCCPRDSQEFPPTPQFKSINSSEISFLYSPTLTSIHDYWKEHSFDYIDLCWQSNVSAF